MTIGIVIPPGVHGPTYECHRLYFSAHFLSLPPRGFAVELPEGAMEPGPGEWEGHNWAWPKGTRVVAESRTRRVIWLLTGLYFPLTTTTCYEGQWPD